MNERKIPEILVPVFMNKIDIQECGNYRNIYYNRLVSNSVPL